MVRMRVPHIICVFSLLALVCPILTENACGKCNINERCNKNTTKCEECSPCYYAHENDLKSIKGKIIKHFESILEKYGDVEDKLNLTLKQLHDLKIHAERSSYDVNNLLGNITQIIDEIMINQNRIRENNKRIGTIIETLENKKIPNVDKIIEEADTLLKSKLDLNIDINDIPKKMINLLDKLNNISSNDSISDIQDLVNLNEFDLIHLGNISEGVVDRCNFDGNLKAIFYNITQLVPKSIATLVENLSIYLNKVKKIVQDTEDILKKEKDLSEAYTKMLNMLKMFDKLIKVFHNFEAQLIKEYDRQKEELENIKQHYTAERKEMDYLLNELEKLRNIKLPQNIENLPDLEKEVITLYEEIQAKQCVVKT